MNLIIKLILGIMFLTDYGDLEQFQVDFPDYFIEDCEAYCTDEIECEPILSGRFMDGEKE